MRKFLPLAFALPMLTACGEVEIPFLAPISIDLPAMDEPDEEGMWRLVDSSEMGTIDDLLAEAPVDIQGLEEFQLTGLSISDPEFDTLLDPEFDTLTDEDHISDPEFDTYGLSDFASAVRVFISRDQELSDDDVVIATLNDFPPGETVYAAQVTDAAVLSNYADGEFALVVEAHFFEAPPAEMSLPMTLSGVATMNALDAIPQQ